MYNQMRAIIYIAFSLNLKKYILFTAFKRQYELSCFKLKSLNCDVF